MTKREKVIKGLECCAMPGGNCEKCPYQHSGVGEYFESECLNILAHDALELLKAQEARVMTLDELRQLEHTDHIIWIEANGDPESFDGYAEVTTNLVTNDIELFAPGNEVEFIPDNKNYGKTWRGWSSRPTDEQREAAPWTE